VYLCVLLGLASVVLALLTMLAHALGIAVGEWSKEWATNEDTKCRTSTAS